MGEHPRPDKEKLRKMKLKEAQIPTVEEIKEENEEFQEDIKELDKLIERKTIRKDYKDDIIKHKKPRKKR